MSQRYPFRNIWVRFNMSQFAEKEDVQKEMRREIKNILREIKFPEDKRELFAREVLELARVRLPY